VKKGRRQDTQRQLQGNLRYFDLATVMQSLGDTQASGTLVIRSDLGGVLAEIDFREGRLWQARLAHLCGEQAFYQLFEPAPDGTFLFQGGVHLDEDAGPVIDAPVMGMLMEAMRLQDEWQLLRARYSDRDRILLPIVDELSWEEDESLVIAYDLWSRLHRAVPLDQLLNELPYCAATILTILDRMVETDQVR
jgi:hypothetical protein